MRCIRGEPGRASATFRVVSAAAQRVTRIDVGRLDKFERTPSGGLRIPADLTRVGVLNYRGPDGSVFRELRPVEEVFDAQSIASLEDAPVTDLHPETMVNTANWKELAVGNVRDVRADGARVMATLSIQDADEIRRIEADERVEVSCGYECDLDVTPGVYDGEPYDAVQRRIRYNHAALGPRGWGRAGPEVALRLDAAHELIDAPPARTTRNDSMATPTIRTVNLDGIPYEAGSESHLEAVRRLIERKDGELAALKTKLEADLASLRKTHDETKGRLDAAELQVKTLEGKLATEKKRADEASSEEELDKRIESRLAIIDRARRVLGNDYAHAGKTDRDIMKDALTKVGAEVADEASDDYVRGAFDRATADAEGDEPEETEEPEQPTADGGAKADRKDGQRRDGVRPKAGAPPPADGDLDRVRKDNAEFQKPEQARSRWAVTAKRS